MLELIQFFESPGFLILTAKIESLCLCVGVCLTCSITFFLDRFILSPIIMLFLLEDSVFAKFCFC